ncbi:EAL-associated domain-containing protein, partial [Planococcus sp. SIMBA_143]
CKEKIKKDFNHFITFEQKKMKAQLDLTESINNQLSKSLKKLNTEDHYDKTILTIANDCDPITFRVYICNQAGYQLSSNA